MATPVMRETQAPPSRRTMPACLSREREARSCLLNAAEGARALVPFSSGSLWKDVIFVTPCGCLRCGPDSCAGWMSGRMAKIYGADRQSASVADVLSNWRKHDLPLSRLFEQDLLLAWPEGSLAPGSTRSAYLQSSLAPSSHVRFSAFKTRLERETRDYLLNFRQGVSAVAKAGDDGFYYKAFFTAPMGCLCCDTGGDHYLTRDGVRIRSRAAGCQPVRVDDLIANWRAHKLKPERAFEREMLEAWQ